MYIVKLIFLPFVAAAVIVVAVVTIAYSFVMGIPFGILLHAYFSRG